MHRLVPAATWASGRTGNGSGFHLEATLATTVFGRMGRTPSYWVIETELADLAADTSNCLSTPYPCSAASSHSQATLAKSQRMSVRRISVASPCLAPGQEIPALMSGRTPNCCSDRTTWPACPNP